MIFFQLHLARLSDGRLIVTPWEDARWQNQGSPEELAPGVTTWCDHFPCGDCSKIAPPTLEEIAAALVAHAQERRKAEAKQVVPAA